MKKLYCYRNECFSGDGLYSEVISAQNAVDAVQVLRKCAADFGDTKLSFKFNRMDDSEIITVKTDDGRGIVSQTARQWADEVGRGLVCSLHFC